jgi:hypothetical protein
MLKQWEFHCYTRFLGVPWCIPWVRAPGLFLEGRNLASDLESFEMLRESTGWVGNFGMIGDDLGMFRRCRSFFGIEGHRYVLRGQSATSRTANGMLPLNGSDCPSATLLTPCFIKLDQWKTPAERRWRKNTFFDVLDFLFRTNNLLTSNILSKSVQCSVAADCTFGDYLAQEMLKRSLDHFRFLYISLKVSLDIFRSFWISLALPRSFQMSLAFSHL